MVTVPKPTQVCGMNILRRARQLLLRNSANYPRNFGRRGAFWGISDLLTYALGGRREMAQATVYQKHSTMQTRLRGSIWCDACPMPKGQKEMLSLRGEALNLSPGEWRP